MPKMTLSNPIVLQLEGEIDVIYHDGSIFVELMKLPELSSYLAVPQKQNVTIPKQDTPHLKSSTETLKAEKFVEFKNDTALSYAVPEEEVEDSPELTFNEYIAEHKASIQSVFNKTSFKQTLSNATTTSEYSALVARCNVEDLFLFYKVTNKVSRATVPVYKNFFLTPSVQNFLFPISIQGEVIEKITDSDADTDADTSTDADTISSIANTASIESTLSSLIFSFDDGNLTDDQLLDKLEALLHIGLPIAKNILAYINADTTATPNELTKNVMKKYFNNSNEIVLEQGDTQTAVCDTVEYTPLYEAQIEAAKDFEYNITLTECFTIKSAESFLKVNDFIAVYWNAASGENCWFAGTVNSINPIIVHYTDDTSSELIDTAMDSITLLNY